MFKFPRQSHTNHTSPPQLCAGLCVSVNYAKLRGRALTNLLHRLRLPGWLAGWRSGVDAAAVVRLAAHIPQVVAHLRKHTSYT